MSGGVTEVGQSLLKFTATFTVLRAWTGGALLTHDASTTRKDPAINEAI